MTKTLIANFGRARATSYLLITLTLAFLIIPNTIAVDYTNLNTGLLGFYNMNETSGYPVDYGTYRHNVTSSSGSGFSYSGNLTNGINFTSANSKFVTSWASDYNIGTGPFALCVVATLASTTGNIYMIGTDSYSGGAYAGIAIGRLSNVGVPTPYIMEAFSRNSTAGGSASSYSPTTLGSGPSAVPYPQLYCIMRNSSGTQLLYWNTTLQDSDASSANVNNGRGLKIGSIDEGSSSGLMLGSILRAGFWNRSLNTSELTQLINNNTWLYAPFTIIADAPTITLTSQNPANLTSITLFSQTATQSYTYDNLNFTNQTLTYKLTKTGGGCLLYINGTCQYTSGTNQTKTPTSITNTTTQTVNYTINENDIYPSTANLNYTFFTAGHNVINLTSSNDLLKTEILNLSLTNPTYSVLEIMLNTTAASKVYICNSTYTTGLISTNANCLEIGEINTPTFNHTHTGGNSSHNIISYTTISNKINNQLTHTGTGYIVIRGPTSGTAQAWTIPVEARTGSTATSNSQGASYTTRTYSLDLHIHQYTNTEYFNTTATGTLTNGSSYSSTEATELIDIIGLNPTNPTITNPLDTQQSSRYINITWLASTATVPGVTIQNYTLTLLNNDLTTNRTITTQPNTSTSYNYDLFIQNLSIAQYYIKITVNDSRGSTSTDTEALNLTRNTELNITFMDARNGTTVTTGNLTIINTNTSTLEIWNTTNGNLQANIIKGHTYNLTSDLQNYSYNSILYTATLTNGTQYLNITLYTNNSITTNIYDENTGYTITENITIVYTGTAEFTHTTTTGQDYIDNLEDGTYTVKLSGTNYTLKQYTVTVGSRSHQTLNAFLSASTQNTIFTIQDYSTFLSIEGATITQSRLINGSWTTVNTKSSDITGRAQFSYTPNVKYRFTVSKTGYNSNIFDLDPVLFSTYTIKLSSTTTQTDSSTPPGQDISITYYPINFSINTNHTLYYIISSPAGRLTTYNLSIKGPSINTLDAGTNAYGETITRNITIGAANLTDKITLSYCYQTTTSGLRCAAISYSITGAVGNRTFLNTAIVDNTPQYEKVIIATIILITLAGTIFSTIGPQAGAVALILGQGYLYYLHFYSIYMIIPGIIISLFFLFKKGGGEA